MLYELEQLWISSSKLNFFVVKVIVKSVLIFNSVIEILYIYNNN